MDKELKTLVESSMFFNEAIVNEAIVVSKSAKNLGPALKKALVQANAKAKSKGYTAVKSVKELTGMERYKSAVKTGLRGIFRSFSNYSDYKEKVVGGQLVVLDAGASTVRAATAIYRNQKGKAITIGLKFHQFLDNTGKLKEDVTMDIEFEVDVVTEAFRVKQYAKGLDAGIKEALKVANAKAQKKGFTPVKSESELKTVWEKKVASSPNRKGLDKFRTLFGTMEIELKVVGGQLVALDKANTTVTSAIAVYRNSKGSIRKLRVKFHKNIDGKGNLKQKKEDK
jgi:hypothetical protein